MELTKDFCEPMEILIRGVGVDLTDELRKAVRLKIGRVRQYAPGAFRARVQIHKVRPNASQNQYRAHVLYEVKGNDVSAEHRAHEPMTAIDLVAEKIERRLRKRKTAHLARRVRRHRTDARLAIRRGTEKKREKQQKFNLQIR